MDWTRLDVEGRVTALRGDACAGVTADGAAFIALLTDPEPAVTIVESLSLDSFGVVGLSGGDTPWLTGRGADGQMHLWQVAAPHVLSERSLETTGAAWAHEVSESASHPEPRGRALRLGGPPDAVLAFGFHAAGPLTVAGALGDAEDPPAAAWLVDSGVDARLPEASDWRRVHLSPTPSELSSVAVAADGRHTWVAGRVDSKPVVYEVLALPFRGLVRTTTLTLPILSLSEPAVDGPDRPVVLVDATAGDQPVFLVATADGNRVCWNDDGTWKAHPAPDGRLHAAAFAGGRIHALIDASAWSLPDPTGS
jgi:hypothetical protein